MDPAPVECSGIQLAPVMHHCFNWTFALLPYWDLYYHWAQYEFILVDSKTGPNSNTINTNTGTTAPSLCPSGSGNNDNPLDDISPLKKNAAFPQVAVASGLMVNVAFLSAFLVLPFHTNPS